MPGSPRFDMLQRAYDDQMKMGKKLKAEKKALRMIRKGKGETAALKKNLKKRRSMIGEPRDLSQSEEGWSDTNDVK